jgi:hypothetical protein
MGLFFLPIPRQGVDSEFGADHLAKATIGASLLILGVRGVIPFNVEPLGSRQYPHRAKLDTEVAPLTPLFYDINPAPRDLDPLNI